MKESARYAKIVAWSEEDQHYIGYILGLSFGGCCHGDDEQLVFQELCEIAEELIEIFREDGNPLPPPTAGYDLGDVLRETVAKYESEGAPA